MSSRERNKRRNEEAAGGDSDGAPPPKKEAKWKTGDASSDIVVCELSKNRRVAVRSWKGKLVVDIREFYNKDGKQLPGKKGITLTADQWKILHDHIDEINKAVTENA